MPDGEVAVRQNGHEHAVDAPDLDGQVLVCLDHGHVEVPAGLDVRYQEDADDDLETDGGVTADRTSVEMRGAGIGGELAMWALVASGLLLISSGYLFGVDSTGSGLIAGAGGILLAFIAGPGYWSDLS
ncbi:hypothetical protein [Halorubrum salinum]|uniref:hypothetical protein n=1 Tax=Halorubrum salinum TaxID=767517 RepID=UPI0021134032|nr:hypothetical protein [Halorubrum salinum]